MLVPVVEAGYHDQLAPGPRYRGGEGEVADHAVTAVPVRRLRLAIDRAGAVLDPDLDRQGAAGGDGDADDASVAVELDAEDVEVVVALLRSGHEPLEVGPAEFARRRRVGRPPELVESLLRALVGDQAGVPQGAHCPRNIGVGGDVAA